MKRRYLTLIEIMIVIVLIGLIGGVVAVNLRGSLDTGKKFKTEQGKEQIYNILMLEAAQGRSLDEIQRNWKTIVKESSLAKNPKELMRDGNGREYEVRIVDDDIEVRSVS